MSFDLLVSISLSYGKAIYLFSYTADPMSTSSACKGTIICIALGLYELAYQIVTQAQRGGAGFFAETTSDWEQLLLSLLGNPALSLGMGEKAQLYAIHRFSFNAVADSRAS